MKASHKNMSAQEAQCCMALSRWQRKHLVHRLKSYFKPSLLFGRVFARAAPLHRCAIVLVNLIVSPLLLLCWLARMIIYTLILSSHIALTFTRCSRASGPGERNINGMHYTFISDVELPYSIYIACINEWVEILYGREQALQHRLEDYLSPSYAQLIDSELDELTKQVVKTQLINAREDLSTALGHY